MPPNKKKKKPTANPARGFATVSVPSKPKPESTNPSSAAEYTVPSESERPTPAEGDKQRSVETTKETQSLQDYTPEELERHLEESDLQLLVEKYASKCRNDAARQVSKLETERRLLRGQSFSLSTLEWLPREFLDWILNLAETEAQEMSPLPGRDSSGMKRSVSEEELCSKLWTLKEAFTKLGFPEAKVEDLLRYLVQYFSGNFVGHYRDALWNLDESLEWLALNCRPEELPSYLGTTSMLNEEDKATSWITGESMSSL